MALAAFTPAQKSSFTGGGTGEVTSRCVRRMPVTPLRELERQLVPVPPSQPMPLGRSWSGEPVAGTSRPRSPPPCSPRKSAAASRCATGYG